MLIENVTILNEDFEIEQNRNVRIEADKIQSITKTAPLDYSGERIDGAHLFMTPGFINCHCHVPMTLLRGYAENLPLDKWLNKKIFPFEAKLTDQDVYVGSLLGIGEMLMFGITSFTDMYDHCSAIADAVIETGIKSNISRGLLCFDDRELEELEGFLEAKFLYENYHHQANGRILVDMCIHGEYTSNEKIVRKMADYSKLWNTNMHIHLSETRKEHEECKVRRGITPAKYMYNCGIFDSPTTAAHCVWAEEEDLVLMAEKNVTVSYNPVSNLKLGSGIANVPLMLSKSLNIALGTDGVSSNNNFNFLEEIKTASLLQKGHHQDAALLDAQTVLKMATINGAKAQGRKNTGIIKEGYQADILLWKTHTPNMQPSYDLISNLVYSAVPSDLFITMVDGRILFKDGKLLSIDMDKVYVQTQQCIKKILSEL